MPGQPNDRGSAFVLASLIQVASELDHGVSDDQEYPEAIERQEGQQTLLPVLREQQRKADRQYEQGKKWTTGGSRHFDDCIGPVRIMLEKLRVDEGLDPQLGHVVGDDAQEQEEEPEGPQDNQSAAASLNPQPLHWACIQLNQFSRYLFIALSPKALTNPTELCWTEPELVAFVLDMVESTNERCESSCIGIVTTEPASKPISSRPLPCTGILDGFSACPQDRHRPLNSISLE